MGQTIFDLILNYPIKWVGRGLRLVGDLAQQSATANCLRTRGRKDYTLVCCKKAQTLMIGLQRRNREKIGLALEIFN